MFELIIYQGNHLYLPHTRLCNPDESWVLLHQLQGKKLQTPHPHVNHIIKMRVKKLDNSKIQNRWRNTSFILLVLISTILLFADIGSMKSFINLSSIVYRPKSSRTTPYAFIVFGIIILNLVLWSQFSMFWTYPNKIWLQMTKPKLLQATAIINYKIQNGKWYLI